jgi:RNA polymerase sigma-70 factor (ECF subfamily)
MGETADGPDQEAASPAPDHIERFRAPECHVIVSPSSETIDMTVTEPARDGAQLDRAAAFRLLADQHLDAAYRLARAILRDSSEAEDATHDAFVQAWRSWTSLRDASRFEQWFDRILVNLCRNRLQRARRRRTSDISNEVALASGDVLVHSIDREVIGSALATLSADHQVVLALRFYRDLTIDEIAARVGTPAGTVRSRIHYALKRLHVAMDAADLGGTAR